MLLLREVNAFPSLTLLWNKKQTDFSPPFEDVNVPLRAAGGFLACAGAASLRVKKAFKTFEKNGIKPAKYGKRKIMEMTEKHRRERND